MSKGRYIWSFAAAILHLFFSRNLQKRSLTSRERGIHQTRYPIWFTVMLPNNMTTRTERVYLGMPCASGTLNIHLYLERCYVKSRSTTIIYNVTSIYNVQYIVESATFEGIEKLMKTIWFNIYMHLLNLSMIRYVFVFSGSWF
jgi:hypothetical protein